MTIMFRSPLSNPTRIAVVSISASALLFGLATTSNAQTHLVVRSAGTHASATAKVRVQASATASASATYGSPKRTVHVTTRATATARRNATSTAWARAAGRGDSPHAALVNARQHAAARATQRARSLAQASAQQLAATAAHRAAYNLAKTTAQATAEKRAVQAVRTLATSGSDAGCTALPKSGGGTWTCTFDDEFNGTTLDRTKWTPQLTANSGFVTGQTGGAACYVDSPNTVSVSGGALNLTVRQLAAPTTCKLPLGSFQTPYVGGMVSTGNSFHQTYGRFEVRALLPDTALKGLQETLWLWPTNDKKYGDRAHTGEIDFAEFYSQYADLDVPRLHYVYSSANAAQNVNTVTSYTCRLQRGAYNTYGAIWQPGRITILLNGNVCMVDNYQATGLASPAPFDQPFFIALTQALGVGTNAVNPSTPLPATTKVDWVRAWK